MTLNFFKFVGRPHFALLRLLAGLMLAPLLAMGADSVYINTGTITGIPPNVDATNFYNSGTWNISTTAPYKTANTLNYTNVGSMYGFVGWEFDLGPASTGQRGMSSTFFNDSRGIIAAEDGYILNPVSLYSYEGTYLLISATNIINKGTLGAGSSGELVLTGTNVNLTRSTLAVVPITGIGNPILTVTNYYPDVAIYDEDWQQTSTFPDGKTPYAFDSSSIWDGSRANSGAFYPNGLCGVVNGNGAASQIGFTPSLADSTNIVASITNIVITNMDLSVTNIQMPSHVFRQAVFVGTSDPNIVPDDRFYPNSDNISNLFQTITVKLSSSLNGSTVYLADTLGAWTNRGLELNLVQNTGNNPLSPCTDPTYRPANYTVSRLDTLGTFAAGAPGLGVPTNTFFYDPTDFSNQVVQADYSAYDAYIDDLVRHPFGAQITNLPGRIVINAGNLDLTKSTIVSAGAQIAIQANNFLGSTGAVIACQNISFNLGSAAGNVNVTNLVDNSPLPAMTGNVYAWSAVWTNGLMTVFTNWSMVTNSSGTNTSGGTLTNSVFTNVTEMDFHVLLVDATGVASTVPVTIQDLVLQTNSVVSDSMNVDDQFLFKGQSFTLNGALNLSGTNLQNWSSAIAPSLLYFTNNGSLTIPQDAYFGSDRSTIYQAFVNNGTITVGGSETIDSVYYQSSGNENAPGGYYVTTSNGKIENANIISGQDMDFTAVTLKLDHSTLSVGNQLNLDVSGSLYDSGGAASNSITCGNGFNLLEKPATGDLLGTALTSQAYNGAEVDSSWAAQDRGPSANGFSNNVALGQLILSPQGSSISGFSSFPPLFYFSGATGNNALYVDLLDLSQITNLEEMVATDPNLVIYYAAAKLPSRFTVLNSNGVPQQEVETNNPLNGQSYYIVANGPSGQIPQEAEEVLNGKLGGHLQWVSSFAGPNSSVDVIISGKTYAVNSALRYSLSIDSNGNGIPNGMDANPFGAPPLVLTTGAAGQASPPPTNGFVISWLAQTDIVYHVQYSTNLLGTNWLPLLDYTNTTPTNGTATVRDTNALRGQRFYRVWHLPSSQ